MPPVEIEFLIDGISSSSCTEEDLPIDSIKKIDFSMNKFPHMREGVVAVVSEG